jgi:phospholipid/cholesterol/gamma-HCH transport system substrate-binding protein
MGFFTLGAVLAVFGFIFWMHSTGGFQEKAVYRVKVENSVSGLLQGAAVLFNGIRVGEVTDLQLNPEHPREVMVWIAVAKGTPVRADTRVNVDFQGLTGVAFISMYGGSPDAPLPEDNGTPPILIVDSGSGQTMGQAARDALGRLNKILDDNSAPLHNAIVNFSSFSDVLANNNTKFESIVAGLERMTGGPAPKNFGQPYDLTAPAKI